MSTTYTTTATETHILRTMRCECPCRRCRFGDKGDCAGCVSDYEANHVEMTFQEIEIHRAKMIAEEAEWIAFREAEDMLMRAEAAKHDALNQSGHIWYNVSCVAYRTAEIHDCNCQD